MSRRASSSARFWTLSASRLPRRPRRRRRKSPPSSFSFFALASACPSGGPRLIASLRSLADSLVAAKPLLARLLLASLLLHGLDDLERPLVRDRVRHDVRAV